MAICPCRGSGVQLWQPSGCATTTPKSLAIACLLIGPLFQAQGRTRAAEVCLQTRWCVRSDPVFEPGHVSAALRVSPAFSVIKDEGRVNGSLRPRRLPRQNRTSTPAGLFPPLSRDVFWSPANARAPLAGPNVITLGGGLVTSPPSVHVEHRLSHRCHPPKAHDQPCDASPRSSSPAVRRKKLNCRTSFACNALRVAASHPAGTDTSAARVAGAPVRIRSREAN